ncbi:MAG: cytidine/deoxycytidylate deaminase family protein [Christensenellaceae bacterium]|nr:cytidine/deoxycytidylate deaminase family protein [Christensenellaceae bacterium]
MDKWDVRFASLAQTIAQWSSCYKEDRQIGAVIVRDKRILTTGYNGAPAGIMSCKERGECMRQKLGIPSGTRHEFCYAIHAEQNALIQAARLGLSVMDATLYCTHHPCSICAKLIVNAGITKVVYINEYPDEFAKTILRDGGVEVEKIVL